MKEHVDSIFTITCELRTDRVFKLENVTLPNTLYILFYAAVDPQLTAHSGSHFL